MPFGGPRRHAPEQDGRGCPETLIVVRTARPEGRRPPGGPVPRRAAKFRPKGVRVSDPWLSVIIPTYNGIDYVESALGSVVSQAGEGVEIVVVDDGSTDGTAERVRGYRDRHGVTLVVRPHGGNWLATTNHGLSLARGDFACVLHQDDVWAPGRIARLREGLRAHPRTAFLIHPSRFIDDRGRHLGLWRCPLQGTVPRPRGPAPAAPYPEFRRGPRRGVPP